MTNKSTEKEYLLIFILIIITGSILRFFDYGNLPLTHDEFSALFRTNFESFSDLIHYGVKTGDTHPAGVQIFLYYWIKLFGTDSWIVKLPFTLAGITSIFLLYKTSKIWFNDTASLLIVAFYSTIQYTVMYSQIARPYGSGMLLSTAALYFWSQLIFNFDSKTKRNIILYVLFSAACAYNHHFNLLFVALLGITGFFLVPNKRKLLYILIGASIFVLYIPHLPIFFHQLKLGGIGEWLRKPDSSFFPNYLYYLHNYSLISVSVTITIIFFSVFKSDFNCKKITIATILGFTPFLVAYFYSIYINPVLRQSVLIFNLPFVLFLIFGNVKKLNPKITFGLVLIILGANTYSLIFTRNHYSIFYKSRYEYLVTDALHAQEQDENTLVILDSQKNITEYYFEKHGTPKNIVWIDSSNTTKELLQLLSKQKSNAKIYLGCISTSKANIIPVIESFFPKKEIQNNYHGGTSYLFSSGVDKRKNQMHVQNFDHDNFTYWSGIDKNKIRVDSGSLSNSNAYFVDRLSEWTPNFTIPISPYLEHSNQFIDIKVAVNSLTAVDEILLVAILMQNEKEIYWGASNASDFKTGETSNVRLIHSIKLSDLISDLNNMNLKVFIWNKGKKEFYIDDYLFEIREGNPIIYGLYENLNNAL